MEPQKPVLFLAVLLIPAVLLGTWAFLRYGDTVDRLARDEVRHAEAARDAFETTFAAQVRGVPLGDEPAPKEDDTPLDAAAEIGIEFERSGDPSKALRYLAKVDEPLPLAVLFAKVRALLASDRHAEASRLLERRRDAGLALHGVPARVTIALLRARAGDTEVRRAIWREVLAGEVRVPSALAPTIVDSLTDLLPPPDAAAVEEFLWLARARLCVAMKLVDTSEPLATVPGGGLFDAERGLLFPPGRTADARRVAAESLETEFGYELSTIGDDALAESVRTGPTLFLVPTVPRASDRLRYAANWCLALACLSFLVGNLVLMLVARKSAALSRLRSDFIDIVSHELRTPLTALSVRSEMLANGDVPPGRVADYQRSLFEDVHRLNGLVHDVLDFGRLERGHELLRPQIVPVRRVVAIAIRASRDALRLGGQKLRVDVPRHLPDLCVDVEVLSRAIRNLIDNATRHAPEETSIELAATAGPARVVLSVRDRGPGLGGVASHLLFAPFRRGKPSVTVSRESTGSGLGLAIVQRAAKAHGGSAQALDREGGGAEFRIEIPRHAEDPTSGEHGSGERSAAP